MLQQRKITGFNKTGPEQGGQTTNLRVGPRSPGWGPAFEGGTPITWVGPAPQGWDPDHMGGTPLTRVEPRS